MTPCKEINFVDVEEVKTQSSKLNFKNDHVSVKTKNSKPQESNPRNNAGKAISKLVDSIADSQKSSNSDLILFLNSQERSREFERRELNLEKDERRRQEKEERRLADERFMLQTQQQNNMMLLMVRALSCSNSRLQVEDKKHNDGV